MNVRRILLVAGAGIALVAVVALAVSAYWEQKLPSFQTIPKTILALARPPDGELICALADGSVQGISRESYEKLRASLGQPDGAANGSQPTGPETNGTSGASGSGR